MAAISLKIQTPDYGDIVIVGGTQIGKTIVAHKIAKMLREEFGAQVIESQDMREDEAGSDARELADWERKMIKGTCWRMHEKGI